MSCETTLKYNTVIEVYNNVIQEGDLEKNGPQKNQQKNLLIICQLMSLKSEKGKKLQ